MQINIKSRYVIAQQILKSQIPISIKRDVDKESAISDRYTGVNVYQTIYQMQCTVVDIVRNVGRLFVNAIREVTVRVSDEYCQTNITKRRNYLRYQLHWGQELYYKFIR